MAPAALTHIVPAMQILINIVVPEASRLNITNTDSGLIAIQSTPRNHTATLPDGYVAFPDIGVAYKAVNDTVDWKQARKLCFNEGAQLPLIDTFKKVNYISGIVPHDKNTFVGIHRVDGEWVSVRDGALVEFIPWAPGYPLGNHTCLLLGMSHTGLYNDDCNIFGSTYVCELPLSKS